MAKAKSIQTTNTNLLYARIVRADGTKTFINKVNANGYSTDAKGPQIPKTRIVQAGRVLKELPEVMEKGECILSGGIAHKLNKKQQKLLANGDDSFVSDITVDLDRLQFVEPETATTARRAERHTPEAIAKRVSKKALKAATVKAESKPSKKRARRAAEKEGIEVDMLTKKTGRAARKSERKEQDVSVIKQMPRELKRLITDGELKLNAKQVEQVLTSLGLDANFYAKSVERHFDGLSLVLPRRAEPEPAPAKSKSKKFDLKAKADYAPAKEVKKLISKMQTRLVSPTSKFMAQHKQKVKEVRTFWQKVFGLDSPMDVKPGLRVIDDYGDKMTLVAIDQVSSVFVKADGTGERLIAHALLNQKSGFGKFKLAPTDELDAAV